MPRGKYSELANERVMAALDGDREAFAELYRCYVPTVWSAVAAALRHRAELCLHQEDIVAEVWSRLLADGCKRLRSFDSSRGPFGYYLRMRAYALARMIADKTLRRLGTVEMDDPFHSTFRGGELEGQLLSRDDLARLERAVREQLNELDQVLFEQVLVLGGKITEVAADLSLTRDVAYRRSQRLRAKVARIAEELGLGGPNGPRPTVVLALLIAFCAHAGMMSSEEIPPSMSDRVAHVQ